MTNNFDPGKVLGIKIKDLSRRELCELASRVCEIIKGDAGPGGFRGGVYPENISRGDDGSVALGRAKKSDWSEAELGFLAPELFWKGEKGPTADVYSVGMLLYYAASGGKLPFMEGSDDVSRGAAQQRRMNGESFRPPMGAGRRVADIIAKATAFKPHERYQSMDEMKAVLDSCVKNLFLSGAPSAETIFKKSDDELSEVERMMISIIEKGNKEQEAPITSPADEAPEASSAADLPLPVGEVARSEASDGEGVPEASPAPDLPLPVGEVARSEASDGEGTPDLEAIAASLTALPLEESTPSSLPCVRGGVSEADGGVVTDSEESKADGEIVTPAPEASSAPNLPLPMGEVARSEAGDGEGSPEEDVKVYEPTPPEPKAPPVYVPILKEEKNPELAPITAERQPVKIPAVQYGKSMERERKINEQIRRRRNRPVIIVLILCALLIVAAILVNAVRKDIREAEEAKNNIVDFAPEATPAPTPTPEPTPEATPTPALPVESTYEIILADMSWTQARDKCMEKGGHLAVISTEEEFNKIIAMAEEQGIRKMWLGCHRIDGQMIWETTEEVSFYKWAPGEPSEYDWGDDVAEDYLLLWYHNGWFYNDSRNDPVTDYPEMYSGQLAYVCEYDGR